MLLDVYTVVCTIVRSNVRSAPTASLLTALHADVPAVLTVGERATLLWEGAHCKLSAAIREYSRQSSCIRIWPNLSLPETLTVIV